MKLMQHNAWIVHDAPETVGGVNLLQYSRPAASLNAWDGNVAAHWECSGNQFIITSNACYVPLPPEVDPDHLVLRTDMRFGPDDPVLWPQLFTMTYPHLGAIPKAPQIAADVAERGVMWWDPTPDDFVKGMSITRSLGKLSTERQIELARPVNVLLRRYNDYIETLPNRSPPSPLLPQLAQSLQLSLERLRVFPATYTRMRLNVTAVQRQYLELSGMLEYCMVYKPRFENPSSKYRTPDDCIGVFTQDPEVAQLFSLAGIPYWFIRPFTAFAQENILRIVTPFSAGDFLEMDPAPEFSPIPTTHRLDDRLRALTTTTKATPWYTNPFVRSAQSGGSNATQAGHMPAKLSMAGPFRTARVPAAGSSQLTPINASSNQKTKAISPYAVARAQRKAAKAAAHPNPNAKPSRDKFAVLDSPEMPASIKSWADALAKTDRSRTPICGVDPPQLYVFPEPALLASATEESRRRVYYHHYRLLRDALMFRLAVPDVPHALLTTQEWRDLLLGKVVQQGKKGTRMMQRTVRIEDLLAPAMEACGIDALSEFPVPPEATPSINLYRIRELLWELAEMNFRFEFLGLDARASGMDRPDECRQCFASTSLVGLDFSDSQRGLATLGLFDRLPYLLRIAKLMCDWQSPCARPQEIDEAMNTTNWERANAHLLERRVAQYYTQSFYELYGRAAVIPMRLDHDFGS